MYMVWFGLVCFQCSAVPWSHFNSNLIHSTTKMQPMRQVLLIGYITKKRMAWDKMTKKAQKKKLSLCYNVHKRLLMMMMFRELQIGNILTRLDRILCAWLSLFLWLPNHMILENETLHTINSNDSYRNFGATASWTYYFSLEPRHFWFRFHFQCHDSVVLVSIFLCLNFDFASVCPRAHINSLLLSSKWLVTI